MHALTDVNDLARGQSKAPRLCVGHPSWTWPPHGTSPTPEHQLRAHNARPTRPCHIGAQRSYPPSATGCDGQPTPRNRCPPEPDVEAGLGNSAGCCAREDIWRSQGPGPHLPKSVRTSWRGPEECPEVRRLAQDQGDFAQGPRLGVWC